MKVILPLLAVKKIVPPFREFPWIAYEAEFEEDVLRVISPLIALKEIAPPSPEIPEFEVEYE